jgi:2-polyprenylphenol 6-hydroxylase
MPDTKSRSHPERNPKQPRERRRGQQREHQDARDDELRFDIILVGGGMVGAALARACSGKGLSVALIETRAPQRSWPAGEVDLRVSALSRASQRILDRLGAWTRIEALGANPYRKMCVWDALGGGTIHFDAQSLGQPDLGHIVENRVIQLALWETLESSPDLTLLCPASIAELVRTQAGSRLVLADGRVLQGAFWLPRTDATP